MQRRQWDPRQEPRLLREARRTFNYHVCFVPHCVHCIHMVDARQGFADKVLGQSLEECVRTSPGEQIEGGRYSGRGRCS